MTKRQSEVLALWEKANKANPRIRKMEFCKENGVSVNTLYVALRKSKGSKAKEKTRRPYTKKAKPEMIILEANPAPATFKGFIISGNVTDVMTALKELL